MPRTVNVTVTERDDRYYASTGSPWEPIIGYSRAVRVGDMIFVTGTIGLEPDGTFAPDAGSQARRALEIIVQTLRALGGLPAGVVRTRIYLTNIDDWQEVGRAHAEVFGEARPATTLVEVARLIEPDAKVEIEADAILRPEITSLL
ncbi:MAG: RidA family protein [Isosphaeraceae bacterium]|nr:RidA family protein [Isosphaeraceae bacterium]